MEIVTKFTDKIIFDAEISERKILILPVASIRHTPYNPAKRTKEGAVLQKLMTAIKRHGLVYPILITEDRDVMDGNRRLAACRAIGKNTIECIVSHLDRDEAFGAVNTTTMAIGGKGWLEVARKGGTPPMKEAEQYRELFALIGTYGIDLLIQQNIGLNILLLCKSICAMGTAKRLEEVIMATALKRLTNKLNAELRSDKTREDKVAAMDAILDT